MISVTLSREADFDVWRSEARRLIEHGAHPDDVLWSVANDKENLFSGQDVTENSGSVVAAPAAAMGAARVVAPAAFIEAARLIACHSDADRYAMLYRLLFRLTREPGLWNNAADDDVHRANRMARAVRRDRHKMTAFVRFREIESEIGAIYIAWFEPDHHIVELTAPFFVDRFGSMRWSILTPRLSAHWDGAALTIGAGQSRTDAPAGDALETLWRTYYASIFNPARLKVAAMQREMPRKYWRNLPEADLVAGLIRDAGTREKRMIDDPPADRAPRAAAILKHVAAPDNPPAATGDIDALRSEARACERCPLFLNATQTVFGEGTDNARLVFVGEQPGDSEDLSGRPFVGPAGQLFDRALGEAGIARAHAYVTNAVKHFKFEPRGKRRIHKSPAAGEVTACRWWLDRELTTVRPKLAVALGATALRALTGKPLAVMASRGKIFAGLSVEKVFVTVHPSFLLRLPDAEARQREYAAFVRDLVAVKEIMEAA